MRSTRPAARRSVFAPIMAGILAACTGASPTTAPASVAPTSTAALPSASAARPATATAIATATATATAAPSIAPPFAVDAFTAISPDAVSAERAGQLDAALAAMAGSGGMTATVMTAQGTWSGAVGKADGVHDLEVRSQFGIASVTKSVVAAQVMQLVEAGEFSLDEPATTYLPADFSFDTNGATIRQLLGMRSGIPDWYTDTMEGIVARDRERVWKPGEVLALVGPARRPAGSEFAYADTNYNLLGLVIEHVRQRPLAEVLRAGVLRVEGTDRLVYQPDEAPTDPMAMPLGEPRSALERGGGYLPSISDASSAGAAGSIASDSISLANWWRAYCAGEIVSEASVVEMSTFHDAEGYGLGILTPADEWAQGIGHLGANFGYVSWAGCLTDEPMVVVVLANSAVDDIGGMAQPLVTAARSR